MPWRRTRLVVRGIHLDCPGVYHRKVHGAVISAHVRVPVQLDGDPGGYVAADAGQKGGWSVEVRNVAGMRLLSLPVDGPELEAA